MENELTPEMLVELKGLFEFFDENGDNRISVKELGKAMRGIGQNPTQAELEKMIKDVDTDRNGYVDFEEFARFMNKNMDHRAQEEEIMKAFKKFDHNGDGFITKDELHFAMTNLGEKLTEEEVEQMIQEADVDGDGKVNYKEFAHVLVN